MTERLLEIQEVVLDLQGALHNANDEIAALREETRLPKQKLAEIDETRERQKRLTFDGAIYWYDCQDGNYDAVCPLCWDSDRKLVRLIPGMTEGYFSYGVHKTEYKSVRYRYRQH